MDHPHKTLLTISACIFSLALTVACGPTSDESRYDPALDGLMITEVNPNTLLPGSLLVIRGTSFVGAPWGNPKMIVSGSFDNGDDKLALQFVRQMRFADLEHLETTVDDELWQQFGGEAGVFEGTILVAIDSSVDGQEHRSAPLSTRLEFRETLTPTVVELQETGAIFVNEKIAVVAKDLLLGGEEGSTFAQIEGCFQSHFTGACIPLETTELELKSSSENLDFDRNTATFVYSPAISGINPGEFVGTLRLQNRHSEGSNTLSNAVALRYDIREPELFAVSPTEVSIGKYVYLRGGGFIDLTADSSSLLELSGEFTPEGERPLPIELILVPEFIAGDSLRYTINEDDALGQILELRAAKGILAGELRLTIQHGLESESSGALPISIQLQPVKQIVYLDFTLQYLDALRSFGLRALDSSIRTRVVENIRHSFHNVNLEIRTTPPDDFSLFSTVQISGVDPNGLGLLGYDNTPGKDSGNLRLHDNIGGVNSSTQDDGYPGYGGVFIESLFLFSEHPGHFADSSALADPLFDEIFDPFRPDLGGSPVRAADLSNGLENTSDPSCPGTDRSDKIACASWALSNMIGSTISHEIGHSLGLANPDGPSSHYLGDAPNRIMDSGSGRPFDERAELRGKGPAVFCTEAYQYLREILETSTAMDYERPSCF